MKNKIVEEPILNLKVEVDQTNEDSIPRTNRMNWPSFNYVDLSVIEKEYLFC